MKFVAASASLLLSSIPGALAAEEHHRRISLRGGEVLVSDFEDQVDEAKNLNTELIDAGTRTGKGGKNYIPVVFPDPGEENPCTGSGEAFLKTNELRSFRNGGSLTCQEAKEENIPQTGGDVTCNKPGLMPVDVMPFQGEPSLSENLCIVSIHYHTGSEHRSNGEYDADGTGPPRREIEVGPDKFFEKGDRCHLYDEGDKKWTKPYKWKHCDASTQIGETIELHFVRTSTALTQQCTSSPWRMQTPLTNGVLCNAGTVNLGDAFGDDAAQVVADNIVVEAQVFTLANPDYMTEEEKADSTFVLSDGMQRFKARGIGQDLTLYSGSTTGAYFGNNVGSTRPCDDVSNVSWQVDRKCHMLSAASMDELCYYMKQQPGMYTCGAGCDIMASNAKFYNGKDGAPMIGGFEEGELCCPIHVRGEEARGVMKPELVADNMIYKNCN